MNIFYRGYVIHQDIRAVCCTIFGRRPQRLELAARGTTVEAMHWVDRHVAAGEPASPSLWTQLAML